MATAHTHTHRYPGFDDILPRDSDAVKAQWQYTTTAADILKANKFDAFKLATTRDY